MFCCYWRSYIKIRYLNSMVSLFTCYIILTSFYNFVMALYFICLKAILKKKGKKPIPRDRYYFIPILKMKK